jgi:hypothetical protein
LTTTLLQNHDVHNQQRHAMALNGVSGHSICLTEASTTAPVSHWLVLELPIKQQYCLMPLDAT